MNSLTIKLRDNTKEGTTVIWGGKEYDDYSYEGAVFIVKKNNEWVGIYNMKYVISIERRGVI